MSELEERFGRIIQNLREKKHISQEAFADLAELERSHYGRIERGEISVTLRTMKTISKALNVRLSQIMTELEKMDSGNGDD